MILGQTEALQDLARAWEEDAGSFRRYDPQDPKALTLTACAETLRRVLDEHSPEWVSIGAVQAWSGWSRQTIRKRCRETLAPRGEARKARGREWEVLMSAALEWPQRDPTEAVTEGETDLSELARLVARAG